MRRNSNNVVSDSPEKRLTVKIKLYCFTPLEKLKNATPPAISYTIEGTYYVKTTNGDIVGPLNNVYEVFNAEPRLFATINDSEIVNVIKDFKRSDRNEISS